MDTDLQVIESAVPVGGLTLSRDPEAVLAQARNCAVLLKEIVSKKAHPVMFGGEQYLEYEDWQTIGGFYGVTAKVISTKRLNLAAGDEDDGYEARAVAIDSTGRELSAAEAMCSRDEANWQSKPMFQLKSMAQTRACAKSLRNVFAWVVVLAGYRPTPAEEMEQQTVSEHKINEAAKSLASLKIGPAAQGPRFRFGKVGKGKTPAQVDLGYLLWYLKSEYKDSDPILKEAVKAEVARRQAPKPSAVASIEEFDKSLSQDADSELILEEDQ